MKSTPSSERQHVTVTHVEICYVEAYLANKGVSLSHGSCSDNDDDKI